MSSIPKVDVVVAPLRLAPVFQEPVFAAIAPESELSDGSDSAHDDDDHVHEAVQHRDGKEPWCKECKLTADGREPRARRRRSGGRGETASQVVADETADRATDG